MSKPPRIPEVKFRHHVLIYHNFRRRAQSKTQFHLGQMQSQSIKQGGDDLEDDFVLDELVALSDNEGPGDARLDDEDVFVNADDDVQDGDENEESGETAVNANSALAKKRKRREKEKERKAKVRCFTFCLVSYSN